MREWRVGRITLGILFLAIGIVLLLRLFTEIKIGPIIKYGVPIVLIILGLEVLIFTLFAKSKVQFSVLSIIIILLVLTAVFSLGLVFVEYNPFNYFGNITEQQGPSDKEPGAGISRYQVDLSENIMLPAGTDKISVDVTNGNLDIIGTETDSVTLTGKVTVNAASQQAAAADVEKYFTSEVVGDELKISYGDENQGISIGFLTRTMPAVNLELKVPASLLVSGDLVNGNISVENIFGELDLEVVNGRITIKLDQLAADIDAETVNGRINLHLPLDSDATISAESKVGSVDGNIDWVDESRKDIKIGAKKSAELKRGLYEIELSTVTGNIVVDQTEQPLLY